MKPSNFTSDVPINELHELSKHLSVFGAKQQVIVIAHKAKTMKLNVEPLYALANYANDELIRVV